MENFFTRYKNPLVLMAVLVIQVIGLATQVRRPDNARSNNSQGPRLIRVWTVTAFTPFEGALLNTGHFFRDTWRNYVDLHNVRRENRQLHAEIDRMRLAQVRLQVDADQSKRLRALLDFKEHYVGETLAAQVIGSSGMEQARVVYIDKGSRAGVKQDMAVITPDGIVGKIRDVYPLSSQVLLINDRDSGAGVILEGTRLQGILGGKEMGELRVNDILSDENVENGEHVVTSGGDRIYPKGLSVGTVIDARPDPDGGPFKKITVKPAADLNRLEEVLVVTKIAEQAPASVTDNSLHRASDILAQRLPTVPKPAETATPPAGSQAKTPGAQPTPKISSGTAAAQPTQTPGFGSQPKPVKAVEPKPKAGDASASPTPPVNPNRAQPPASTAEKPPR